LSGLRVAPGVVHYPGFLDRAAQEALAEILRKLVAIAPLFTPTMPRTGTSFSVRMSNCGALGWVSDISGYRYQTTHPVTGAPWPPMPDVLLAAWATLADYPHAPQACLINHYAASAKMGLHQDKDEQDFDAPVVSLSLGDTALFRIGGISRRDPTCSFKLASGDALVFGGPARLAFHGIDRLLPGSSTLLSQPGRINLTLRRVTKPMLQDERPQT
jgi:DNA oxidative demethylase